MAMLRGTISYLLASFIRLCQRHTDRSMKQLRIEPFVRNRIANATSAAALGGVGR